jgi:molybdopterin-guanine dinucleotide biosynthesis protein A
MSESAYDAVVLAGGMARRLGGVDKAAVEVAGWSLLDRVLTSVETAETVVVVGDRRATQHQVEWVRERPAGGGPVAGLAAALPVVTAEVLVLLACDLPLIDADVVRRLVGCAGGADGALLVDRAGRRQPLAAAYRSAAIRAAVTALGTPAGRAMRDVIAGLTLAELAVRGEEALDCDTWADVALSSRLLEER